MALYREKTDTKGTGPLTLRGRAPEVQQNTSPTFPPVPDNGASPMQGIETPETADNLPQGVEQ